MIIRRIVVDDGRTKREVPLVGTITVGRDPACQISDPDPLLSRRHAEFVATAHAVTIRDLGSRNGLLVNGAKVPERVLVPGDLVQVGRLQCLYVEETAPAPPPTRPAVAAPLPARPATADRTVALPPPLGPADEPIAPLPNIPTGNEPTFVPAGWRAESVRAFDDTKPDQLRADGLPSDADATRPLDVSSLQDSTFGGSGITGVPGAVSLEDLSLGDIDATAAMTRVNFEALARDGNDDETMAPLGAAAPIAPLTPGQARLVTGPSLLVSEASASGLDVFGMSPQSLVGASIPDLVVRALGLMAAGEGPSSVSLTVERRANGGPLTVTFTAPSGEE